MSLVANNSIEEVSFESKNFIEAPDCKLGLRSYRKRGTVEQQRLCSIIIHTTRGIPGGKDLRPQVLHSGEGPDTNAGPRMAKTWQTDLSKFGGSHLIVDKNGLVWQCCDLLLDAAYHCQAGNGHSIGIEVVQGSDAGLYEAQIETTTLLVNWLTARFGIQRQICQLPYRGKPVECLEGKLTRYGVFGHRNLTSTRGAGDPGDYLLQALQNAGYEDFDFNMEEDLETWKNRQGELGIDSDGVPGPGTVQALKEAGYQDGLWVQI
jgi:hypothetical protein